MGGSLGNFIPCKSSFHSFSFSALGPKGRSVWKGNSFSNCSFLCLSYHFLAYVAFKKGKNSSASQRTDYCSEVGWQVRLQINILLMHIYA